MYININEIQKSENGILRVNFAEGIEGIDSEGIVKAEVTLKYAHSTIEVKAHVNLDINVECVRCLKRVIIPLDFEIDEVYVLGGLYQEYPQEIELTTNNFVEDLKKDEEKIDITDLIYQSIILNMPNNYVCDINCMESDEGYQKFLKQDIIDPRLQVFKDIKIKKEG